MQLYSRLRGKEPKDFSYKDIPRGKETIIVELMRKRRCVEHLMRLNDQATIDRIVGGYIRSDGGLGNLRIVLADSASPYVLDELSQALFVDDESVKPRRNPNPYWGNDFGLAHEVARTMLTIIETAPEFSTEVQQSAASADKRWTLPLVVTVRTWWEESQDALLAEKFDQVKGIELVIPDDFEPHPNGSEAWMLKKYREGQARIKQQRAGSDYDPSNMSASDGGGSLSEEQDQQEGGDAFQSNYLWWVAGAILAALVTTLWFRKCRRY